MSAKLHRFDEFTESEIQRLVDSLESLNEGELGVSMLVACGVKAIPALRSFLLHGRPRVVYQPRQRAVRALAELEAKDVLLEYLRTSKDHLPPEIRYAEEAVESTAARHLSRWQTDDVFETLLALLSHRVVTGAIETLGEFRRAESVPALIRLLGDDVAPPFAADAIRKIGSTAAPELVEAAITPDPRRSEESPSSIVRRKQALGLLLEIGEFGSAISRMEALLYDPDPEIAARVAQMILQVGDESQKRGAVEKLLEVYKNTNWIIQSDIQKSLACVWEISRPFVEKRLINSNKLSYSEATLLRSLLSSQRNDR